MMAVMIQAQGPGKALDDVNAASGSKNRSFANNGKAHDLCGKFWKGKNFSVESEFCRSICLQSHKLSWTHSLLVHWNTQMMFRALLQVSINATYGIMDLDWESKILVTRGSSPHASNSRSRDRCENLVVDGSAGTATSQSAPITCKDDLPSDDEPSSKRCREHEMDDIPSFSTVKLACPFRKHDPGKYNFPDYAICASRPYQSIPRIKEHIYRQHQAPIHCSRCLVVFDSEDVLDSHLTAKEPCEIQKGEQYEGISIEMSKRLRSMKREFPRKSKEDRWRDIYRILFPDEQIPTPYFEPVPEVWAEFEVLEAEKQTESDSENDGDSGSSSEIPNDSDNSSDIYGQSAFSRPELSLTENLLFGDVMAEFWEVLNRLYTVYGGSEFQGDGQKLSSDTANKDSKMSSTSIAGIFNNSKRKHSDDQDDNLSDDDDERAPKRPRGRNITQSEDEPATLPCPYRKHNPSKYGIYHYPSCALTTFRLHRLKEHLFRRHKVKPQCVRCWLVFNDQNSLNSHLSVDTICPLRPGKPMDGVTPEMEKQIRKRKKSFPGQTDGEIWGDIYRVLFPREVVPQPIYDYVQDNVAEASGPKLTRDDFVHQEVPRIFEKRVRAYITGLGIGEDLVVAACVRDDYVTRMTEIVKDCQKEARSLYGVYQSTLSTNQEQGLDLSIEAMPPLIPEAEAQVLPDVLDDSFLAGLPAKSFSTSTLHDPGPVVDDQYNMHGADLVDDVNSSYHLGSGIENDTTLQESIIRVQCQTTFENDADSFSHMGNIEQESNKLTLQLLH